MKKLAVVILSLFMLTGCFGKTTTYQEVSFSKLESMFKNKESFSLFIGSSECSHCQSYEPKLNAVIKVNKLKVYYINVANLSIDEYNKLDSYAPFSGTPYTVFIEKGKVKEIDGQIYAIDGDRDIEYIEKMFKKNGYM